MGSLLAGERRPGAAALHRTRTRIGPRPLTSRGLSGHDARRARPPPTPAVPGPTRSLSRFTAGLQLAAVLAPRSERRLRQPQRPRRHGRARRPDGRRRARGRGRRRRASATTPRARQQDADTLVPPRSLRHARADRDHFTPLRRQPDNRHRGGERRRASRSTSTPPRTRSPGRARPATTCPTTAAIRVEEFLNASTTATRRRRTARLRDPHRSRALAASAGLSRAPRRLHGPRDRRRGSRRRRISCSWSTSRPRWPATHDSTWCRTRCGRSRSGSAPRDQIAIVSTATRRPVVLEPTPGDRTGPRSSPPSTRCAPGGSTDVEAGLRLGYALLRKDPHEPRHQPRAALLRRRGRPPGPRPPRTCSPTSPTRRPRHLDLDHGGRVENYDDVLIEQLADRGNGNYDYVDRLRRPSGCSCTTSPARLQVVARDAKLQIEFDPEAGRRYRLLGYENRALARTRSPTRAPTPARSEPGTRSPRSTRCRSATRRSDRFGLLRLRYDPPDGGARARLERALSISLIARQPVRRLPRHRAVAGRGGVRREAARLVLGPQRLVATDPEP